MISVDPQRIRFQHARIRPQFSGCRRSLAETLQAIRNGDMAASDLPPIQVLVGPVTTDGPWYFSLNNRRLWVLKRCRDEGLLVNNQILVRVRQYKSQAERERYTLANCVVEAKVMRETSSVPPLTKSTATTAKPLPGNDKVKGIKTSNRARANTAVNKSGVVLPRGDGTEHPSELGKQPGDAIPNESDDDDNSKCTNSSSDDQDDDDDGAPIRRSNPFSALG